jgi:glutathione synthase
MSIQLGVSMDPISSIKPKKDSTFAMLLEAQKRGWSLHYMEQTDLFLKKGIVWATMRDLKVKDQLENWFELEKPTTQALHELDIVLMRKDPPANVNYFYTTYLLEHVQAAGTLVVNRPQSLRDVNEKLFTTWFPECCPPTLVTCNLKVLREFLAEQEIIICKPLDSMGGHNIFKLQQTDENTSVVFETLTQGGTQQIMAQRFIPEISQGDKRILMIDGNPVSYALARVPAPGETRGNLAAGGRGSGVKLSPRDRWICDQVGPALRERGLLFVGLDVIGDYLTEINVTSPTCIRELDALYHLNISAQLLDALEAKMSKNR